MDVREPALSATVTYMVSLARVVPVNSRFCRQGLDLAHSLLYLQFTLQGLSHSKIMAFVELNRYSFLYAVVINLYLLP